MSVFFLLLGQRREDMKVREREGTCRPRTFTLGADPRTLWFMVIALNGSDPKLLETLWLKH